MRLNGFDLNQVLCLEALLAERSVSRAAERVHLSQSAMSWVLAQLREHFNDPLLVRSGRHLVLTPFARTLMGPVSDLLSRAHALTALSPDQAPTEIDRELKIVASDYSISACLGEAMKQASEQMPRLRFDVLPLTTHSALALASGELDLLFAGQALDVGRPPNELLFEDEFACLVCAEHGPKGRQMTAEQYLARRHVVLRYFEQRMSFEDEDAVRRIGGKRVEAAAVWSTAVMPQLIIGTPLVATLAMRAARTLARHWPVRLLPFPLAQEPMRSYIYWHPSRDADPVLARFVDIVRAVARQP